MIREDSTHALLSEGSALGLTAEKLPAHNHNPNPPKSSAALSEPHSA